MCEYTELTFSVKNLYPITSKKLKDLMTGGQLPETIINAYLHLLTLDEHAHGMPSNTFKIFDTALADRIRTQNNTDKFGPPCHPRGRRPKHAMPIPWVKEVRTLTLNPV